MIRPSSFVLRPPSSVLLPLLFISLILSACSSPITETEAPSTPQATAVATTATPEPTATPIPSIKIGYVSASPEVSSVREAVQRAAQEFGWEKVETQDASADSLRALAQSGAIVVVAENADLLEVAREFPDIYFISLQPPGADNLPTNLLALGPSARHDQAGFLAGMAAGLATETQIVTMIGDPNSPEGRNYRNGFLHGFRYTCPECRILNIDVMDLNNSAEPSTTAATYFILGSDVFFAAAGQAGDEALAAAAEAGASVIGSGEDVYLTRFGGGSASGAERVLTSFYFDPGAAVYEALSAFQAGVPLSGAQAFSAVNSALVLAPYRDPQGVLSTLDQTDIATALARLADDSLGTGIDPVTGEEL